jgi:type IV secretion system protein VirB1
MIAAALLACALNVAPVTLEKIITAESGGNPVALNVNHLVGPQPHPATVDAAAATARQYIAAGYSVDIGLTQINSRNLVGLGLTVEQALDPCTNVRGGAAILTANYVQASVRFGEGQTALLAAVSAYNTGDFWRGFSNGYVARVVGLPALTVPLPPKTSAQQQAAKPQLPNPYTAETVAYSRGEDLHVSID